MKSAINTWDLFDTLIGRFMVEPHYIFPLIEERSNVSGYAAARQNAQQILDKIGQPYTLYDIYRCMEERLQVSPDLTKRLIAAELAVEMDQLIPIRRQIDRVAATDLIVSDMYFSADQIVDILKRVCGLHTVRPPVVGNWGKASGSIWPYLASAHLIRKHYGDNPHSDHVTPKRFHIPTELVSDAGLTDWEQRIIGLGMSQLAFLIREVRLRKMPLQATSFHSAVIGPYMTFLLCAALSLQQLISNAPRCKLMFVSRDCCHVSQLFRVICPDVESEQLDLTRRLLQSGNADIPFSNRLTPGCLIIDMMSSGASLSQFFKRTGIDRQCLFFLYFDLVLTQAQLEDNTRRINDGRVKTIFSARSFRRSPYNFEVLLDPGHPTVLDIRNDDLSGALVKVFGPDDYTAEERRLVEIINGCVSELATSVARRGLPGTIPVDQLIPAMKLSIEAIGEADCQSLFPSFLARERP